MSVKHRRQPPAMATVNHLSFLTIITLILSVQSNPNLHPTDHKALLSLHNHLHIPTTISTTAGIFSEQTTTTTTTVLRVTRIILPNRRLKGSISPSIGNLTELKQLILSNNHLINQIPIQISTCRNLEILDLHNNRLSGQVPVDLSSLTHLRILDLSFNKLTGDLHFIKYFPNLETLSLNNNMFTGKIPISLKLFRNLILFNISGNSFLEDPFPVLNQLESHNKKSNKNKKNDKDNNLLNKVVPKRYSFAELDTRNETRDERNKLDDVMAPGPSPTSGPVRKHGEKKKKKVVRWILGFVAGAVGGIICGAIVSVLFKMVLNMIKGKKSDSGVAIFSQQIKAEELAFLESEEGVAGLQIIGKGGCGEVYKTELLLSKVKTIAVKKIVQPPKDAAELTEEDTKLLNKKMRQIKSEIQTVGQIRHRNLVPLLAHVSRPNCHYLVYEFMKNGSLQDILQQVKDGSRELDWLARHRIALGVAAGLEYLHMSHTPRIVHRDLKPANVLLDDDMEARIADFGLAKSIPDADTHMTSSNVAGTLGYIAPEYHQTLKFTDKCDIYSFGVVLAVLVMGKLPSDEFFQRTSEMNMVKWLRNVMTSEDPKQAIDPKLMGYGHEEQMLLVLKIACFCTLDNPKERPNSKDVRLMLAQIIH